VLHVALADPDVALKLRAMLLVQTPRTRKSDHWWLGAGELEQLELVPLVCFPLTGPSGAQFFRAF